MVEKDPFSTSKMVMNALTEIDLLSLDLHYLAKADGTLNELKGKIDLLQKKISNLCLYSDFIGNACITFEADKPAGKTTEPPIAESINEVSLL